MRLLCVAFLAFVAVFFRFYANVPTAFADETPRPRLEGNVDDNVARFRYGSDGKDGPMPSINHWVCNDDTKGLIFVWDKARLTRGIFNPLDPDQCQENPHHVAGINSQPDYDAPIRYTQSGRSRTAAIYTEKATANKEAKSSFKTTYTNLQDEKQQILVEIEFQVKGESSLDISIAVSPPDLMIGLGSTEWIVSEKYAFAGFQEFNQMASAKGINIAFDDAKTILYADDSAWLPASLQQNSIFLVRGKNLAERIVLPISLKSGIAADLREKLATMYVFDVKDRLIGTGAYSQLSPE